MSQSSTHTPPVATATHAVRQNKGTQQRPSAASARLAREIRRAGDAAGGRLLGGTEATEGRNPELGTRSGKARAKAVRGIFQAVGVLVEGASVTRNSELGTRKSGGTGTPMRGRGNATVYLTAWPPPDHPQALELTRATSDRHDRAHGQRYPEGHPAAGLLIGAGELGEQEANPRRYPEGHFNGNGVAIDSSFDALYERLRWMERELGGVAGMSVSSVSSSMSASIEQAARRAGSGRRLRSQIEGKGHG